MSLSLVRSFGFVRRVSPPSLSRRRFGVPVGGPFDRESAALAQTLASREELWELGMADATFRCEVSGTVAVVGAPCSLSFEGKPAASQASFPVAGGIEMHVSPPTSGARVYVSFNPAVAPPRRLANPPESLGSGELRVVAGPQAEMFDLGSFGDFRCAVGHASDRVGIRLVGAFHPHSYELPSEPACVGAIQVTGSGDLVILGPDGPTIGGYPKVAVIIDADLDRVGQLRPRDKVRFRLVSLDEAREASLVRQRRLARLFAGLGVTS